MRGIKQTKLTSSTTITSTLAGGESEERISGPSPEITSDSRAESEENIFNYGYGVGITSCKESDSGVVSARDHVQPVTRNTSRPGFEIGYQREVEVKIERRSAIEGPNRSRDIDVEEGHRYGARPGRLPGPPPEWSSGPRQIRDV